MQIRIYGYQRNTVRQFDGIYTQISIQAKPKGLEGSETKVNSPQLAEKGQRIMKLRERLEEIKVGLAKDLPLTIFRLLNSYKSLMI